MYCKKCYYDLRGLGDEVCPECGEGFNRRDMDSYLITLPDKYRLLKNCIGMLICASIISIIVLSLDFHIFVLYLFSHLSSWDVYTFVDPKMFIWTVPLMYFMGLGLLIYANIKGVKNLGFYWFSYVSYAVFIGVLIVISTQL